MMRTEENYAPEDRMDTMKYIEVIVLEILNRFVPSGKKGFNIGTFNAKEAAYAFLRQNDGENFVKAQEIKVWFNNQELHLCVRDLIYGKNSRMANTSVEFIYRKMMFSEIKWPAITINRLTRVRWANDDKNEKLVNEIPEIYFDEHRMAPCMSCRDRDNDPSLAINSTGENTGTSFCRNCQLRRSMNELHNLINDGSLTLGHGIDQENHFRSSIHIDLNHIETA